MWGFFPERKQTPSLNKGQSRPSSMSHLFPTHLHSFSLQKFLCTTVSKVSLCYFLQLLREKLTVFLYCEDYDIHVQVTSRWGTATGTRLWGWARLRGCSPPPWAHRVHSIRDSGPAGVLALRTQPGCGTPGKPSLTPAGAPPAPLPRPSPCPGCPCPSPAQRARAYREPRREQQRQHGQAEQEAAERLHGCTAGPLPPHGAASGAARPALGAAGGAGSGTARPGHARHPRAAAGPGAAGRGRGSGQRCPAASRCCQSLPVRVSPDRGWAGSP